MVDDKTYCYFIKFAIFGKIVLKIMKLEKDGAKFNIYLHRAVLLRIPTYDGKCA